MVGHTEKITCIINHTIILMDGNFTTVTRGDGFLSFFLFLPKAGWEERASLDQNTQIH